MWAAGREPVNGPHNTLLASLVNHYFGEIFGPSLADEPTPSSGLLRLGTYKKNRLSNHSGSKAVLAWLLT